ncbi:MAG: hypothetical protein JXX14_22795 [Deltaproteobacteria bacterium]|nr:hypothetical protein [Deltaproteobacteria bacterium]
MFAETGEVIAAQNGLATFDGLTWQTVVAPDEGLFFNAMDGYQAGDVQKVIAVGNDGEIIERNELGWHRLAKVVTADLLSVHMVNTDFLGSPYVTVTGADNTVLTGPLAGLSVCSVQGGSWRDSINISNNYEYFWPLVSTGKTILELETMTTGGAWVLSCSIAALPSNWLKSARFPCAASINTLHLTTDGVYAKNLSCIED